LLPAFGQADLSNCEREQIQLPGSIQPHGALLVVREPDYIVVQASANASSFLRLTDTIIGAKLEQLPGDLYPNIKPHLAEPLHAIPIAVRCRIGAPPREYDSLLHRPPEGGLIIELEPAGPAVDLSREIENSVQTILSASSLRMLCDETARIFETLTGYDRVMVYRFDDDGHGEVFSEQRKPHLEAFLGNRYPASDIPQIARRLYERNRVRLLFDVNYTPSPLTPRLSPLSGRDLDMSLCFLRSHSPIHVQYLKNMGVGATLVVSLMVGGRLWGLISCHHYVPRFVHFETRAVCELLAEAVGTRIAALESFIQAQSELTVRRIEQRMIEAISRDGDWRSALFDGGQSLLQPLGATGAALIYDGQVFSAGEVPGTQEIRAITEWLDKKPRGPTISTASLGLEAPEFATLSGVASGLIAAPLSSSHGDYLLWFRPERIRTVTWGGDPHKPVIIGNDPSDLSPRRSFAQWHQIVEGTADPWTPSDVTAARLIGDSVADVALQFRSVGMLIAQDQLESISRRVRQSDQPVVIADASGRILLTNEAFEHLMRPGHPHITRVEDLPQFFTEPLNFKNNLWHLLREGRAWRGEVGLETDAGAIKVLMLRADPVFSTPERVLGFVFLFTDVTERKAAEAARRRFQESLIERPRVAANGHDSGSRIVYQDLLAAIVENAQLAALEITYGADTTNMKGMLDSVRTSVTRSSELLQHLIWHADLKSEQISKKA
jgi:light-regulated signal transduction histidine kinase (bacteriophytochrome)